MSGHHCLDIEFLNVEFGSYNLKDNIEVSKVHHAHLTLKENEIELKIFFEEKSYFGDKFMHWASKFDWKKLGTFLKVEATKNHANQRLQKVDLSEAKLVGYTNGSDYYEDSKKCVSS